MGNRENNYFSHDSNARNSDKLIRLRMRHKAAGYGVYFMILERLREEPGYMSVKDYNMIAFDLREDASLIKSVVEDFGLFVFTEDGKYFYSESFKRRMAIKDEKAKRQSEAGRKAMEKRWKKETGRQEGDNQLISNLPENGNMLITEPSESDNKESKVKERKEKEIDKEKDKETNTCEEPEKTVEEKCLMTFKYFNDMTAYYHSSIKPVKVLTQERMRKLENVVRRYDRNQIASAIRNAMNSDFLNGRTARRKMPADFDWIFEERNFTKIFEGSI